jgi:hypothetical protein
MSEEITKDEIKAIIETQSKATEQMVIVAGHLKTIADEQKKISAMMTNGLKKEIIDGIITKVDEHFKEAGKVFHSCNIKMDKVGTDVTHAKWFIGVVGTVVIVVTVILRIIGLSSIDNKMTTKELLKHWETLHKHAEKYHSVGVDK